MPSQDRVEFLFYRVQIGAVECVAASLQIVAGIKKRETSGLFSGSGS